MCVRVCCVRSAITYEHALIEVINFSGEQTSGRSTSTSVCEAGCSETKTKRSKRSQSECKDYFIHRKNDIGRCVRHRINHFSSLTGGGKSNEEVNVHIITGFRFHHRQFHVAALKIRRGRKTTWSATTADAVNQQTIPIWMIYRDRTASVATRCLHLRIHHNT